MILARLDIQGFFGVFFLILLVQNKKYIFYLIVYSLASFDQRKSRLSLNIFF